MSPVTQIQDNSHILGIYSSPQRKIEEGLEYLRMGFEEKNEAILMITDELTKDEVRKEILKKWKISEDEFANQEKNGIINIKSSRIFYFSTNILDYDKILKQYSDTTNKAITKGKRGLRAFADVRIFFERDCEKHIIEIEKLISPLYDTPLMVICAYDLDDFERLDHQSRKILFDHHILHIADNLSRSIFDKSFPISSIEHICMLDEENQSKNHPSSIDPLITNSILRYIREGLQQDHLCVYLSLNNIKKNHSEILLSQLSDLKDSQLIGDNLMIVPKTDDYYINAWCENLKPFDDLKKQILKKSITVNKKVIRIICDIPDFLFKHKHFDQCIALEEWWNETLEDLNKRHGLNILLLCIYNSNTFQNLPFKYHRNRINDNHSIICDSEGIEQSKFLFTK